MRHTSLLLLLVLLGCDGPKQAPPPTTIPTGPALAVGDAAPPLGDLAWLHGTPVAIAPGTVYVVEFWATWHEPSRLALPLLNHLAKQFEKQGVVFVSIATEDQYGSDRAATEKFLADHTAGSPVHHAFSATTDTYDRWMIAAGQETIPCCIVVDAKGKLAWIGPPTDLAGVLPRIAAGTWGVKAMAEAESEWQRLIDSIENAGQAAGRRLPEAMPQPEKEAVYDSACHVAAKGVVADLEAFLKANPWKARQLTARAQLMNVFLLAGRMDQAKALAEAVIPEARKETNLDILAEIRIKFVNRRYNPERKHVGVAVQAAQAILAIVGDANIDAVLHAAEAYKAAGDTAKFEEMAGKAREIVKHNPEKKRNLEVLLASFQ